jgi:hypothetical protein
MFLIVALKGQDGRACGLECEVTMCIFGAVRPPAEDPSVKAQREEDTAKAEAERKVIRQEALERRVSGIRGGTGRRSLITSSGGGMGFYNEYKK